MRHQPPTSKKKPLTFALLTLLRKGVFYEFTAPNAPMSSPFWLFKRFLRCHKRLSLAAHPTLFSAYNRKQREPVSARIGVVGIGPFARKDRRNSHAAPIQVPAPAKDPQPRDPATG